MMITKSDTGILQLLSKAASNSSHLFNHSSFGSEAIFA